MKNVIRSLLLAAALLPAAIHAATIAQTVTIAGGGGNLQGATVTVTGGNGTGGSCTTNFAGTCTLTAAQVGTNLVARTVTITATGYTTNTGTVTPTSATQAITRTTALNATTGTTRNITGTVTSGGNPVQGATVAVSGVTATATTNAAGTYNVAAVTLGNHTITVTATGFTTGTATANIVTGMGAQTIPAIVLTATTVIHNITGTVLSGGVGVAGATVSLSGTGSIDTALTDDNGDYEFTDVSTGNKTVTATMSGFNTNTGTTNITATTTTATVNITLTPSTTGSASISGQVTGAGAAVSGATVTLTGAGTPRTATTNATGNYTFTNVAAGSTTVSATATGFGTTTRTVTVATTNLTINFSLTAPLPSVAGQVTDVNGAPLAGVRVQLSAAGTGNLFDTTDAQGRYSFANVTPATGNKTVTATLAGYGTETGSVTLSTTLVNGIVNLEMEVSTAVYQMRSTSQEIRFSTMGNYLAIDLGVSKVARSVTVYSMNGMLRNRTSVPAGASRAVMSSAFAPANGFLFQVK